MIMDELTPVSTFSRCVSKKSLFYLKLYGSVFLSVAGIIALCIIAEYVFCIIGLENYVNLIIYDILLMAIFTCLITIYFRPRKLDYGIMLKQFLMLHIVVPLECIILFISAFCVGGIPALLSLTILMCIDITVVTMLLLLAFIILSMSISCAVNDCLHVDTWMVTNCRNVFNWLKFKESDSL